MNGYKQITGYPSNEHNTELYARKHITLPVSLAAQIDDYLAKNGGSRSSFFVDAAAYFLAHKTNNLDKKNNVIRSAFDEVCHTLSSKVNRAKPNADLYPFPTIAGFVQCRQDDQSHCFLMTLNSKQEQDFAHWIQERVILSEQDITRLFDFSQEVLRVLFAKENQTGAAIKINSKNNPLITNKLTGIPFNLVNQLMHLNSILPAELRVVFEERSVIEIANQLAQINMLLDEKLGLKIDHDIVMPYDLSLYNEQINLIAWLIGQILLACLPTANDVINTMLNIAVRWNDVKTDTAECIALYAARRFTEWLNN